VAKRKVQSSFISENPGVVGTLVAGGLLGVAAALLLTTKKGQEIQDGISDFYHDASDKFDDLSDQVIEKSTQVSKGITDKFCCAQPRCQKNLNLVIGGIAGGVLGIVAALAISGERLEDFRNHVAHTFEDLSGKAHDIGEGVGEKAHHFAENLEDQVSYWTNVAHQVIGMVKGDEGKSESFAHKSSKSRVRPNLEHFLDWAALGVRLFQSIRK
jgi:gas vesicle protein